MWNIDYDKDGTCSLVRQEEHLLDAIEIAQAKANEINHIVNVHNKDGYYTVIHPEKEGDKCSTS